MYWDLWRGNLDTGNVLVIMSIAHAQSIFMPMNVRPVYCHHSFVSYARPSGLLARLQVSICHIQYGSVPLGIAAGEGYTKIVQRLLEAGANVSYQNKVMAFILHFSVC